MTAKVTGLQRSNGGVPKLSVDRAMVGPLGMEGDKQRHRRFHGGPTRALCLYSAERLHALAAEGHPVAPGVLGENVTIAGLDWERLVPGVRLRIGAVGVEVTAYAAPCKTIAHAFVNHEFVRISQKRHSGWSRVYVMVWEPGPIAVGDPVTVLADSAPRDDADINKY